MYYYVFSLAALHKSIKKEVCVLRKLNHPSIIKLKNAFIIDSCLISIMEFASGGELKDYLYERGRLSETEARLLFIQMLSAVNHCHSLRVIHRDLKLENILFADLGHRKIKVVDFGIAGLIQDDKAEKSKAGSSKYMAPEVLSDENIEARPSLDVWSMGCILFALVTGELPFNGKRTSEIIQKIIKGEYRFPADSVVSYHCRKLIRSMLNMDYRKRIAVKEIFKHPWIIGDTKVRPLSLGNNNKATKKHSKNNTKRETESKRMSLPKIKNESKMRNVCSYEKNNYKKSLLDMNYKDNEKDLLIALELLKTKPPVPKFNLAQSKRKHLKVLDPPLCAVYKNSPDKFETKYYNMNRKKVTETKGKISFTTTRINSKLKSLTIH